MSAVLGTLESASPSGHVLRLVLEQAADRVAHRIEVLDPAQRLLAELRSVEGSSADHWPPSPALQSCSLQEVRPAQTAAFLVGMAGSSHWSASMEAVPAKGELVLDLACRVQSTPQWLGNSYEIRWPSPDSGVDFQLSPAGIAIFFPASASGLCSDRSGRQEVNPLRIACAEALPAKFPATLCWKYRIYLAQEC